MNAEPGEFSIAALFEELTGEALTNHKALYAEKH